MLLPSSAGPTAYLPFPAGRFGGGGEGGRAGRPPSQAGDQAAVFGGGLKSRLSVADVDWADHLGIAPGVRAILAARVYT